ncbi:hypothetical protein N9C10_02950 [Flavobacteriaceae bacterium]|nr:hypothetical protein [Flavobacteriaceae bacterium]
MNSSSSCKEGKTFIDEDGMEIVSSCDHTFKTKKCQCFASSDTKLPNEDQFCGFEQDGFIFPCDVGCCDKGCPGQCPGIDPKPPSDVIGEDILIINNEEKEIKKVIATLFILIIGLVIISTLSLFIQKTA